MERNLSFSLKKIMMSVSVVIPAYNSETDIEKCVSSVLSQTFPVLEIIIVNDGSNDNTASICGGITAKQSRENGIPVICITVPNGGVAKARNLGIKKARGNYISFLDSDDQWVAEKIQKQLAVFEQYPMAALVCSASTVHRSNTKDFLSEITLKSLLVKNNIVTSSVLVKKEVLPDPAFNESLRRSEDFNLWIKVAKKNTIYKIGEELVVFAKKQAFGASGLSKNLHAFERDELRSFKNLLQKKIITFPQFLFAVTISLCKYIKRCFIVASRKRSLS